MTLPEINEFETDPEWILEYEEEDRKRVFEAARKLGCKVVIANPDELQLDIDHVSMALDQLVEKTGTSMHWWARKIIGKKIWESFSDEIDVLSFTAWRSRHGNTHVVLKLSKDYSIFERIAFQALLGSDPIRELLNWKRAIDGSENPVALFRPLQEEIES